ncbi:MAG: hypothetical protein AB8H79_18520, partial [Myxococcota bacterium]
MHQKIFNGQRLKRDKELDVSLDWVEVDVEVRVNGDVTTDPRWAGELRFSHNAQPSLATNIAFTPGSHPTVLLPEGLYDLTFTRDYFEDDQGGY